MQADARKTAWYLSSVYRGGQADCRGKYLGVVDALGVRMLESCV